MQPIKKIASLLLLAFMTEGYAASAPSPAVEAAVATRKANYKEIGGAFKTINDEIKSGAPDFNTVRPLARDIAARSASTLRFFPRGSGPESGLKTRAKAEIWAKQADFIKLQKDMIAAANALNTAAASGNATAMASNTKALGGACKACHDRFREDD
jgi:cytochrome c556